MTRTINVVTWVALGLFVALALLLLGSMVPLFGGYQLRIVQTGSMRPTMPIGSVVVVSPAPTYQIGDILTFRRAGDKEATTHRLVKISQMANGQRLFIVKGDANNADDMRPVLPREVIGKVHLIVPYLGYVLMGVRSPFGFLLIVIIPAALIVWEQGKRIASEVKKARSESTST